ncbi:retrotransposon protein [Hordeum vulgare]|nr:retrotransposon protein [Hordeum vulgare]
MVMPMLMLDNYTVRAIKAQAILDVNNVWEAMEPGDAAVNAKKCKTVRALILGALPEDVQLQVATKLTTREVWDSLKMADGEALDAYAGRLAGITARYTNLGETLGDAALVKKLLDTVPDRPFPAVTDIEQFCDTATMAFNEALGRLQAFDERVRRRGQDGSERGDEQLLVTMSSCSWRR